MLKSDRWIIRMSREKRMIEPFEASQVKSVDGMSVISYGVSSYGYDMRVSDQFKVYRPAVGQVVDPKKSRPEDFEDFQGSVLLLPPQTFCLGVSVEYFRIPRNVITVCTGKSTYARCGVLVNVTPLELFTGWLGF